MKGNLKGERVLAFSLIRHKKDLTIVINSDDHYIYSCVQESLRRNGISLIVNKRG